MKNKKPLILTVLISLILISAVFVFNISNFSIQRLYKESSVSDMSNGSYPGEMIGIEESAPDMDFDNKSVEPSKIITNMYLSLETVEFDLTINNLNKIINENKGYIENSNIYNNNYMNNRILKRGDFSIRIPVENLNAFTSATNSIGNIVSESTSKQDITKQYYDIESRLTLLNIKEERILSLLEKAEKIEDILTIENQLHDIIYEKENLNKSILDMDDKISYSTVSVNISEVEKLTSSITTETKFSTKVAHAFNDSLYFFKSSIEKFVILFVYALPYVLIVGLISFSIYVFTKKRHV